MKKRITDADADALVERITNALDVPEPSPLFWEHFPARVRAAVAAEPPAVAPTRAWWRRPASAMALAGALAIGIGVWTLSPAAPSVAESAVAGAGAPTATVDDAGWSAVSSAAATAGVEGLGEAGFGVAPGDADAALEDLTQDERAAFVALLRAEVALLRAGMEGSGGL